MNHLINYDFILGIVCSNRRDTHFYCGWLPSGICFSTSTTPQ